MRGALSEARAVAAAARVARTAAEDDAKRLRKERDDYRSKLEQTQRLLEVAKKAPRGDALQRRQQARHAEQLSKLGAAHALRERLVSCAAALDGDGLRDVKQAVGRAAKSLEKLALLVEEVVDVEALPRLKVRTTLCGALAQASSRRDAAEDALHEAVAAAEATLFPSQKKPAKRSKTTPKLKLEPDDQRGHVLRVTKAGAAAVRKASHVTLLATRRGGEVLFTTKDVARRASELLEASNACHAASAEILRECSKVAGTFRAPLRNAARLVGDVDALLALAECASQRAWTRPTVDGKALTIEGLRHPLVDEAGSDYIPSDLRLGGDGAKNRCWLVTGAVCGVLCGASRRRGCS